MLKSAIEAEYETHMLAAYDALRASNAAPPNTPEARALYRKYVEEARVRDMCWVLFKQARQIEDGELT